MTESREEKGFAIGRLSRDRLSCAYEPVSAWPADVWSSCAPEALENLHGLDLTGCELTDDDLAFLTLFPNLKDLVLDHNEITSHAKLPPLPTCTSLSLNRNAITDYAQLAEVLAAACPQLSFLSLMMNPGSRHEMLGHSEEQCAVYRSTIVRTLPHLHFLDTHRVEEVERPSKTTTLPLSAKTVPSDFKVPSPSTSINPSEPQAASKQPESEPGTKPEPEPEPEPESEPEPEPEPEPEINVDLQDLQQLAAEINLDAAVTPQGPAAPAPMPEDYENNDLAPSDHVPLQVVVDPDTEVPAPRRRSGDSRRSTRLERLSRLMDSVSEEGSLPGVSESEVATASELGLSVGSAVDVIDEAESEAEATSPGPAGEERASLAAAFRLPYNTAMRSLRHTHAEPLNAYMHFGVAVRPALTTVLSNPTGPRMAGIMVDLWEAMPPRGLKLFEALAQQDMASYCDFYGHYPDGTPCEVIKYG
ncbi:uncharacterized protein MONBRDRAFT_28267 [Monosiga brevicollis MX1]|uniref:Leucine-rich repeat-containing protein 51 n=1 Tax=Monosiga brevicollis TaxID=81824 RepID=A9V7N7_MONBE|nr:uncharacterized protein MONBRDRAFT_28267 [Monosiga brevicollis MX1]EDQ86409.1 predicted protein [Monosiga brevicollis MX1]|eukprot:XP_001748799.1 hypothetical protein [Monosiga brevicollis MX1]